MRKYWPALLQGLLSAFLIYHLFNRTELRHQAAEVIRLADPAWLALGVVTALATESLCAVRWWVILRLFGTPVPLGRVFAFCGAGLFFSLGLPGAAGGDAFRILYVIRLYPRQKLRASLSVMADRLCGLVALVIAFVIAVYARYDLFGHDPKALLILKAASLILGGVVFLVSLWWLTTLKPIRSLYLPLESFRKKADRLGHIFLRIASGPRYVLVGILLSLVALAFHFTTYFCSAKACNLGIRLLDIFTVMPFIDTLILLPVSLFGIGLRENLFEQLLAGLFGVTSGAATMTSLGGFGLQAFVAILGGLLIPFTLPDRKLRD